MSTLKAVAIIVLVVCGAALFAPDGRVEEPHLAVRIGAGVVVFVILLSFMIGRKRKL